MATAGTGTYDTTGSAVYSASLDGCTSFMVHVSADSSNPALVHVSGLHDTGEFITIRPGGTLIFRRYSRGMRRVWIKGSGGDAVVDWGIVAKVY